MVMISKDIVTTKFHTLGGHDLGPDDPGISGFLIGSVD